MRSIITLIIIGMFIFNSGCTTMGKGAKWVKECWIDNNDKL